MQVDIGVKCSEGRRRLQDPVRFLLLRQRGRGDVPLLLIGVAEFR